MKIFNNPELDNTSGRIVTHINCEFEEYKKLSEFDENWEINSECPKCKRKVIFNKNNVNKIITCKCEKKLVLVISEKLL